jgi:hypothetical protein
MIRSALDRSGAACPIVFRISGSPALIFSGGRGVARECLINGNANPVLVVFTPDLEQEAAMGRGILLWLLGIPIPIIILILIFWH